MSENAKYWIWLQNVFGYGAKISKIIDEFGGAKELYNLGETEWRMSSFLTNRQVEKLISTDIEKGNEVIDYCLQQGYRLSIMTMSLIQTGLKIYLMHRLFCMLTEFCLILIILLLSQW